MITGAPFVSHAIEQHLPRGQVLSAKLEPAVAELLEVLRADGSRQGRVLARLRERFKDRCALIGPPQLPCAQRQEKRQRKREPDE